MTITLSEADRERLGASLGVLLSPLAYPVLDDWRRDVTKRLKDLIGADFATFVLPVEGVSSVYTDHSDDRAVAEYPDREPGLPGGVTMWQRQAEEGVWNRAALYREHIGAYYRSEYYNEWIVPLGGYDALGATIPIGPRIGPDSLASVLFHHERPNGRRFGRRGLDLLGLCFPAFEAGVRTYLRLRSQTEGLARILDASGAALILADVRGRELHRTPALLRALERDPELERSADLFRLVHRLTCHVGNGTADPLSIVEPPVREFRTFLGRYRVYGSRAGVDLSPAVILLTLERVDPEPMSDQALQDRFGLTPQQIRVARLLGDGRSNRQIAEILFISPHTARRHTERVLLKLGAQSRAEVGRILFRR